MSARQDAILSWLAAIDGQRRLDGLAIACHTSLISENMTSSSQHLLQVGSDDSPLIVDSNRRLRVYPCNVIGSMHQDRPITRGDDPGALPMHRLRLDGFVYLESTGGPGLLATRPLFLRSGDVRLNVQAAHEVRVTDPEGRPLPGYTFADAEPRWSGTTAVRVTPPSVLANLTWLPFEPTCENPAARSLRTTSRYGYGFTYSGGGVATGSSKCSSNASRRFAIASARVLPWLATSTPRARATNHSPSRQTSAST